MHALEEFKNSSCVQKLKIQITFESMQTMSCHEDLVTYLYNCIVSI